MTTVPKLFTGHQGTSFLTHLIYEAEAFKKASAVYETPEANRLYNLLNQEIAIITVEIRDYILEVSEKLSKADNYWKKVDPIRKKLIENSKKVKQLNEKADKLLKSRPNQTTSERKNTYELACTFSQISTQVKFELDPIYADIIDYYKFAIFMNHMISKFSMKIAELKNLLQTSLFPSDPLFKKVSALDKSFSTLVEELDSLSKKTSWSAPSDKQHNIYNTYTLLIKFEENSNELLSKAKALMKNL